MALENTPGLAPGRGPKPTTPPPRPSRGTSLVGYVVTEGSEPCGCHWRREVGPTGSSYSDYECATHRSERIRKRAAEVEKELDFDLLRRALHGR